MPDIPNIFHLELIFVNFVRAALAIGAVALFVVLVMGGLKYLTSGGDPKAVEGAQKTITMALGGLFLVLTSYLILVLIKTITGVDVTQFRITQ